MNRTSIAVFIASQAVLTGVIFYALSDKEPPFNELCHQNKVADYDLVWDRVYDAQISLEICREEPATDTFDPTDYCKLHADMEAKILEAVPCMRSAIETDKTNGIIDPVVVRITEAQLNEYLMQRNDPEVETFGRYTQDLDVWSND